MCIADMGCVHASSETRGVAAPAGGVTGTYEPLDADAGTQTQILYKRSTDDP